MASVSKSERADGWMSLVAASAALRESRMTVLNRIVAGELVGRRVAGRTVVRRDTVERMIATRDTDALVSDVA